jgi:calcineurin-like phosphoesterase family protein
MSLFFTSDLHFGHKNILKYNRGEFDSVEDMEDALISRINDTASKNDILYILGDVSFYSGNQKANALYLLARLNPKLRLVMGNHDKGLKSFYAESGLFETVNDGSEEFSIKHNGKKEYLHLSHFPMMHWSRQGYGSVHLYGHLHGHDSGPKGRCMDIGADTNNLYPYHLDDILNRMLKVEIYDPRQGGGHA